MKRASQEGSLGLAARTGKLCPGAPFFLVPDTSLKVLMFFITDEVLGEYVSIVAVIVATLASSRSPPKGDRVIVFPESSGYADIGESYVSGEVTASKTGVVITIGVGNADRLFGFSDERLEARELLFAILKYPVYEFLFFQLLNFRHTLMCLHYSAGQTLGHHLKLCQTMSTRVSLAESWKPVTSCPCCQTFSLLIFAQRVLEELKSRAAGMTKARVEFCQLGKIRNSRFPESEHS